MIRTALRARPFAALAHAAVARCGVACMAMPSTAMTYAAMPRAALIRAASVALCLALPITPVAAQTQVALGGLSIDRTAQVEVTADSLRVDQTNRSAVFEGNVVIGQGDMRISAGRVEVAYAATGNGIARLLASGGVTFVTATEQAEAREADYNIDAGQLVLTGDVLLSQMGNALSAESMVIDLATGAAQMQGRVTTVFGAGN